MSDYSAIIVTLKLALTTSLILMIIGLPFAWWLARPSHSRLKNKTRPLIEAIVALPLVLPPTVLGFYLLIAFSPDSWLGASWFKLTGTTLAFSFSGLVIGSIIYSLPFVIQPLQNTFAAILRQHWRSAHHLALINLNSSSVWSSHSARPD